MNRHWPENTNEPLVPVANKAGQRGDSDATSCCRRHRGHGVANRPDTRRCDALQKPSHDRQVPESALGSDETVRGEIGLLVEVFHRPTAKKKRRSSQFLSPFARLSDTAARCHSWSYRIVGRQATTADAASYTPASTLVRLISPRDAAS